MGMRLPLRMELTNLKIILGVVQQPAKFQPHSPDQSFFKEKVKLELGDVMFYWLKVAELWNLSVDDILSANKAKLVSRHPEFGEVKERFGPGSVK